MRSSRMKMMTAKQRRNKAANTIKQFQICSDSVVSRSSPGAEGRAGLSFIWAACGATCALRCGICIGVHVFLRVIDIIYLMVVCCIGVRVERHASEQAEVLRDETFHHASLLFHEMIDRMHAIRFCLCVIEAYVLHAVFLDSSWRWREGSVICSRDRGCRGQIFHTRWQGSRRTRTTRRLCRPLRS